MYKQSSEIKKEIIGKALQSKREKLNYSRTDLANKVDVMPQFVANWERGQCLPPSSIIPKLQELFSMTPVEFVNLYSAAAKIGYENFFGVKA